MEVQQSPKNVLITGIAGYISQYLLRTAPQNVHIIGTTKKIPDNVFPRVSKVFRLDLRQELLPQLEKIPTRVDVVLHTAAISSLRTCEDNAKLAKRVNGEATAELARWCRERDCRMIYFSTDIVFKGDRPPYDEQSQPDPINSYGLSKWQGELAVQEIGGNFAIGRIALALGHGLNGTYNFIDWFFQRLQSRQALTLFTDEIRTPTYVKALARRFWQLAFSKETGIFHVCGSQAIDRFSLGKALCDALGYGHDLLTPISLKDMSDYPRPADVSLVSTRQLDGQPFTIPSILEFIPALIKK